MKLTIKQMFYIQLGFNLLMRGALHTTWMTLERSPRLEVTWPVYRDMSSHQPITFSHPSWVAGNPAQHTHWERKGKNTNTAWRAIPQMTTGRNSGYIIFCYIQSINHIWSWLKQREQLYSLIQPECINSDCFYSISYQKWIQI